MLGFCSFCTLYATTHFNTSIINIKYIYTYKLVVSTLYDSDISLKYNEKFSVIVKLGSLESLGIFEKKGSHKTIIYLLFYLMPSYHPVIIF